MEKLDNDYPMISVEGLSFAYPAMEGEESQLVLDDINITINAGDFVAVLGHNGSGKSTLAKLLNAQMLPSQGNIKIAGMNTKNEDDLWNIRAKCGIVFQNPDNQMVASIVEEDVAFGPENLGVPLPELRFVVDEALKAVDMYDFRRREPQHLSGGQKQRIAIAGVLAMQPDCIIMDEPTAMLDPIGRREIMESIEYLNKEQGKTILMITHFMEEAAKANRVLVMHDGKIVMDGTPKETFSQVEQMRELELDVPQVTELAYLLHKEGLHFSPDLLTIDDFVEAVHEHGI